MEKQKCPYCDEKEVIEVRDILGDVLRGYHCDACGENYFPKDLPPQGESQKPVQANPERWEATLMKARRARQGLDEVEECPECGCWLNDLLYGYEVIAVLKLYEQAIKEILEAK